MMGTASFKRLVLAFGAVALVVPTVIATVTQRRGSKVADELCSWLNDRSSGEPPLRTGPQTAAILEDLRETGAPVSCTSGSSPYADSFFTETALLLRSSKDHVVGLRIAPLGARPVVLGHWTPMRSPVNRKVVK